MLSYSGCHVSSTYIGCIGTHAYGRQVTSLYLRTSGAFFKHEMRYLIVSKKKIHYSSEGRIENYVPRDHVCHHSASLMMPNGDPRDAFFYPTLTLMVESYILLLNGTVQSFPTKTYLHSSRPDLQRSLI